MELDLYSWLMIFLRVGAFLLVLPFFSVANFPPSLRVALSALIAILLAPLLPPFHAAKLDFLSLISVMIQEITVGLLLGFVARLVFYAVDIAGNMIAGQMGLISPRFWILPVRRASRHRPQFYFFSPPW